jgi:hypothetical protein
MDTQGSRELRSLRWIHKYAIIVGIKGEDLIIPSSKSRYRLSCRAYTFLGLGKVGQAVRRLPKGSKYDTGTADTSEVCKTSFGLFRLSHNPIR